VEARKKTLAVLNRHLRESQLGPRIKVAAFDPEEQFKPKGDGVGDNQVGNFLKRAIPKDFPYDPKALKPLAQALWAMSVAHGHTLTAHRQLSKVKSSTISPDGLIGGRGYVMSIKDVRKALYDAAEGLSAISDTMHDEINAAHWKPRLAELEREDVESVERLVGEAEQNLENPEEETEEDMEQAEKSGERAELEEGEGEPGSEVPTTADLPDAAETVESTQHVKQASGYTYRRTVQAVEIPIGALERSARGLARKLERQGFRIDVDVFKSGRGGELGPSYVTLMVDVDTTAPDGSHDTYWSEVKFYAGGYYSGRHPNEFGGGDSWHSMASKALKFIKSDLESQGWTGTLKSANSSIPVETLSGPRVQHMDRGDVDQTGPFGSYNNQEPMSTHDNWSRTEGVPDEYVYQSEWDNELLDKTAKQDKELAAEAERTGVLVRSVGTPTKFKTTVTAETVASDIEEAESREIEPVSSSALPGTLTDTTPTEGYDFGIGYGDGNDAHGQGAGGYGTVDSDGKGVYGPSSELPNDPGAGESGESDTTPTVELEVGRGGPEWKTSSSTLPLDILRSVARSDYYDGDKGDNEVNATSALPGVEESNYEFSKDMHPGVGYRFEQGHQPYIKWDSDTHNMKHDYVYQREVQGPYEREG
jgi:hypothetical protein